MNRLLKPFSKRKANEEVESIKDSTNLGKALILCGVLITGYLILKVVLDDTVKVDKENRKKQNPSITMQVVERDYV